MDDHYSTHAYPRTTDPKRGLQLSITNVQTHSFSVNVGISPKVQLTPNNGIYNPTTGMMTLEFATPHGLTAGTSIKIAKESLTFSCGFGGASGDAAKKSYPRSTDPFYDTAVKIESATTNAITVKILENVPSTNTDAHTWVGATTGCIHTGGDYEHIFHSALTNGVVANKHGLLNGDRIKLATNSLTFTCQLDNQETEHSYPRSTDPYNGRWLAVSNVGANTFDVNVGISPDTSSHIFKSAYTNGITKRDGSITFDVGKSPRVGYDVAGATYDPLTGDMVLNVGIHNLLENQTIQIADNGLSFTCSMDGNATSHSYPRLTDPSRKHALNITNVGETSKTITGAVYTPTSGQMSLTVTGHNLNPATTHTPTDATYNPANGDMVLTIGSHLFQVDDSINIADESITFSCNFGGATGAAAGDAAGSAIRGKKAKNIGKTAAAGAVGGAIGGGKGAAIGGLATGADKVKKEEVVLEADSLSAQVGRWEAARQKRMKQRQSYERPHWIPRDQDHEDNWGSSKGEKRKPQKKKQPLTNFRTARSEIRL